MQVRGFLGNGQRVCITAFAVVSAGLVCAPYVLRVANSHNIAQTLKNMGLSIMERGVALLNCANPSNIINALSKEDQETCYYQETFLTIGFLSMFLLFVDFLMKCWTRPTRAESSKTNLTNVGSLKKRFENK